MTKFFTSDLHLGHERIIELADRPFASVDEMDEMLIHNWNKVVRPNDLVYVLGDLAMGSFVKSMEKTKRLMGRKFLVPGNHDRVSSLYRGSAAKKIEWRDLYVDAGFCILGETQMVHVAGAVTAMMCHFPFEGDSHGEDRYVDARPKNTGQWLLHGHTHDRQTIHDGKQFHVGVDAWEYMPVHEDQIEAMMRSRS